MRLPEIEDKITALKQRYDDLDKKLVPLRNGVIDPVVANAMAAADAEINRLSKLREKALVSDLIEQEAPKPATNPAAQALSLPRDFKLSEDNEVDPTEDLKAVPDDPEAFGAFLEKLFRFALHRAVSDAKRMRAVKGGERAVAYTQGQHWAIFGTLANIQVELKALIAIGRDRRNQLERKLLSRIEALENDRMTYRGTWSAETQNNAGDIVTDHGSAWYCKRSTRFRPGNSDDWVLMVKKGRDGKDAAK